MVHQERCVYQAQKKERESIRQKLALGSFPDDGLGFYCNGHRTDKPDPSSRLQNGMNLQMCFINDSDRDNDQERDADDSRNETVLDLLLSPLSRQISPSSVDITDPLEDTDFLIQQEKLRTEARLALALATPMAKMQVEVERQTRRKSPVVHLLPHISECLLKRSLKTSDLKVMTLGQLQVIVNDMHSQIESLNEELVQLLLGRDQLHVEQDAILVDIEDLTRHAESHPRVRTDKTFSK